jgi:uncharacterized short protein YbdD (DUF466 family)
MWRKLWRYIRRVSGDDAYDRYLCHQTQCHPGEPPLSRQEFFKREQERQWGGIRRCC